MRERKMIKASPLVGSVAAVSVGIVDGEPRLDLCYKEDVAAETDMNVVCTGDGRFVRVRASTEFYIFPTDTVLPSHRSIVNQASMKTEEPASEISSDPRQAAIQLERQLMNESQQQPSPSNDSPKFKY